MKKGRFSAFRFSLLIALTGFFLYSTLVQEIHYMFIHHQVEVNDHCDNHLHAKDNHADCSLCKIELSSFVQSVEQYKSAAIAFLPDSKSYNLVDAIPPSQYPAYSLRGPPFVI